MALEQWEILLFEKYNVVALGPFHSKVQLFDVLVKTAKLENHPKLINIGSLLDLQKSDANTSSTWEEVSGKINAYLEGGDEKGLVKTDEDGTFKCSRSDDSGVLVNLFKKCHIGGGRSKAFSVTASQVNSEAIVPQLKTSLFKKEGGLWVPDLEKIQEPEPLLRKNGNIEIWVVTEMKYCTQMIVKSGGQTSAGGGVSVPDVVTGSMDPIDAEINISRRNNGDFVVKGKDGKQVPLGFKAIKLEYDRDGKLKHRDNSGGKITPAFRADNNDDDAAADPDNDSKHMADLFLYEGEERVACLEIERYASSTIQSTVAVL